MRLFKGISKRVRNPIIGMVTKKEVPFLSRKDYVFCGFGKPSLGYVGILNISLPPSFTFNPTPTVYGIPEGELNSLRERDILSLNPNGDVNVLWDSCTSDNCLLVTETCNCRCIICPQPPRQDSKYLHRMNKRIISLLDPEQVGQVCLTGGEPTLHKQRFLELLGLCRSRLPETELIILTNAQTFADFNYTKEVVESANSRTMFCVSLHADTSDLQNSITGSQGGFRRTISGLYNLAKLRQNVEIRFVINRLNYRRLIPFSHFVYRNFPFVSHIAFMGLEMTGSALANADEIWVDPLDYHEMLRQAVKELHRRDLRVSIYNVPLCLIDRESWPFARQSISKWKNAYLEICSGCSLMDKCCGIFTTSGHHSQNIHPIE